MDNNKRIPNYGTYKVVVFLIVGIGAGLLAAAFRKRVDKHLMSQRMLEGVTFADDLDDEIALFV